MRFYRIACEFAIDSSVFRNETNGLLAISRISKGRSSNGDTTRLGFVYQSKA